jgi:hypothetical protein
MSAEPRRCASCGASAPRPEARFCEHCGARLAEVTGEAEAAPVAPPPDPLGDVSARFRALAARPELASLLAAKPVVPELGGKLLPSLALLAGLSVLGCFAALVCFQVCPPLGFVPLALVGVGVLVILRQLLWSARTPLVARPALLVELRARLQAGAERSPAHTRHFATLRFEDGRQSEHECYASALPALAPGTMGVAYLKGERLAVLTRLEV